jgi:hypothetical protein
MAITKEEDRERRRLNAAAKRRKLGMQEKKKFATEEERIEAYRKYKREWAAKHFVPKPVFAPVTLTCAYCSANFIKMVNRPDKKYCSDVCGVRKRNREHGEKNRRAAGIPPRKVLTQDDYRAYFRQYSERKRREVGVPVKKRVTDEQREANKRAGLAKLVAMFNARPEDRKAIRRKSATKGRIADTLNVPLKDVPQELLEAYVLHLDVQRYIRRNK